MNRLIIILIYISCLPGVICGQSQIDSLKRVIKLSQHDSITINAYLAFFQTDLFYSDPAAVIDYTYRAIDLSRKISDIEKEIQGRNNLGYIFRTKSEPDSALYHYNLAIDLAGTGDYYKGLTDAYIGLGNVYNQQSKWTESIEIFNKVITLAREEGDSIQIASANNNIGNAYLSQSKFEQALTAYQKGVELGDQYIREIAMINMAVVHNQMGHTERARKYFKESIQIAEALDKKGHVAFIHKNLGLLEKKSGNYDLAIQYYEEALEHYVSISDDYLASEIIQNLGNVYFELKDYAEAIEKYQSSLEIQRRIGYSSGACYNLMFLANALEKQTKYNEAISYLDQVEICSDSLGLLPTKSDAANLKSKIYAQRGNFDEAYQYLTLHKMLSDSLQNMGSEEKIAELETRFQTERKEQEIELLNAQNEVANLRISKQKSFNLLLTILALSLIIITGIVIAQYRNKVEANKHLQELDDIKNRFYTDISHEFRTPLTLILNPLSQILESENGREVHQEVELAHRNASRLLELTNQMLDLSKLEAGKLNLEVSQQHLASFLKIISDSFRSYAQTLDIDFQTNFFNVDQLVFFDADKLSKILTNLISNALKYTPARGKVIFNANLEDKKLYVEIIDSGKGISEQELSRIFDRYFQSDKVHAGNGTGIGLTLTKELVELHRGKISFSSEKDHGSNFNFWIPIDQKHFSNDEMANEETENTLLTPLHLQNGHEEHGQIENDERPIVLIVEDNAELRIFLSNLLINDYQVILAKDGKEGLEKAKEYIPDLIISDWMMPEMSGEKMCGRLKKDQLTSHIPIIILTARADQDSKLEGLTQGADNYLNKPFDNQELLLRARNLINQRQALKEKYSETFLIEPTQVVITDPDKLFLEKIVSIIEAHIDEPEYSVEKFTKDAAMSRMQLHRKLKALTNQSASEFIRNFRLKRAADLLASGNYQVSEVAYQCGFNNISYFGKCFKEKYGQPPSQYLNFVD
ncbi:tetratricopeptide repeat protein [Portibacter marinus]|uniref:tetratricopeptide repeat protein n=1 Tax=Portibacter marinus TaxID=2898660 RepID=UPI001F1E4B02|nr:tetratricopeptide repeat protein [Portibacter marinus]